MPSDEASAASRETVPELRLDPTRLHRTGLAEAVYAPGKTPGQCVAAVLGLLADSTGPVVLSRADEAQVTAVLSHPTLGKDLSNLGSAPPTGAHSTLFWRPAASRSERIVVLSAGTADLPVARETQTVLTAYGFCPQMVTDVGVAGLHRVLGEQDTLAQADAVIVIAGMEGALASVVTGLTPAPVIAVPTSTGYGASLEGITALLGMLASCSPGITVVGIDNGLGAACAAIRIFNSSRTFDSRELPAERNHD